MAEITKEALQAKLVELNKQTEQGVANLNAIQGAKQQIEMLLAELKTPPPNADPNRKAKRR